MTVSLSKRVFDLIRVDDKKSSADFQVKEVLSEFQKASLQWLGDIIRPSSSRAFWDGSMYMWWLPERSGNDGVFLTENNDAIFVNEKEDEMFMITNFRCETPRVNAKGILTYNTTSTITL
jgi:hypothetical protein